MIILTADEIKRSMLKDQASGIDENLLVDLEKGLIDDAERFVSRYIKYGTYEEIHSGGTEGRDMIFLKGIKIWELKQVKVKGTEQSLDNYMIIPDLQGVYCEGGFPGGTWNIYIQYTAGFSGTEIGKGAPDGLKRALIDEIALRYDYLQGEARTGESLVDLKKNFLSARSERYFNALRRPCL